MRLYSSAQLSARSKEVVFDGVDGEFPVLFAQFDEAFDERTVS